ncbi:MAG: pilus assembly protein [Planctomycetes bacterium]|nr:pilus assembly protein [Planctomycetota bacterium]
MRVIAKRNTESEKRPGSIAVEMLIILPVFLVILLGFVELTMLVIVEERLAAASYQGARVASQGGSTTDVETAVHHSLGPGSVSTYLNDIIYTPTVLATANSGDEITVRLEIEAKRVIPDLLRFIGYSISNQILVAQTVMRKE